MATTFKFEYEGFKEADELFRQIEKDFGEKDAQNIMRNAVRLSMQTVLKASRNLAPKDTGAMAASLQVETRRPSKRDKNSKYVYQNDAVIGLVTTASGKKLAEKKFKNIKTGKKEVFKTIVKEQKFGDDIISTDQRVSAMEFGNAKTGAKPFLRPALEMSAGVVADSLGNSLKIKLEQYKAKQAKRKII